MPRNRYQPTHRLVRRGWAGRAGRAGLWICAAGSLVALLLLALGPRTGWYRTLTVASAGTQPGIPAGALVIDTPEKPADLRVGQIITYQIPVPDHQIVSRRVVTILSGGPRPVFQTKGDASAAPDPWTVQSDGSTLWRVRAALPLAGRAIQALREPALQTGVVLAVMVLLALIWLVDIRRRPRSRHGRTAPLAAS